MFAAQESILQSYHSANENRLKYRACNQTIEGQMVQNDVSISQHLETIWSLIVKVMRVLRAKYHDNGLHALHGHQKDHITSVTTHKTFELYNKMIG
jgi:hypothetical protein